MMNRDKQLGGLAALDFIRDVLATSPREVFKRKEIVRLLELAMRDRDTFSAEAQVEHALIRTMANALYRAPVN